MSTGQPLGKLAIENHVEAHIERLSRDGAFYTVPCPRGDDLVQIQVYAHPSGHWHYVTYGFTSLFEGRTPPDPSGPDGFGYELTYRVPREGDAASPPPSAPFDLLRALARVLVEGRHILGPNHTLPLAGPIAVGSKHSAFAVAADPELGALVTPLGRVEMLLLVGITADEERACARGSTAALLDRLRALDPLLVTRHDRAEILDAEAPAAPRLDGQRVIALDWRRDPQRQVYVVAIEPRAAREAFVDVVFDRMRTAGVYWLAGPSRVLRLERRDDGESEIEEHTKASPPMLLLKLAARDIDALRHLRARRPDAALVIGACELVFADAVDPRVERVRAAFVDDVPSLASGVIRIDKVAGTPGTYVILAVSSSDRDVDPIGDMVGLRGLAVQAALRSLGGQLTIVETRDDPLRFAMEALRPAGAARYAIDAQEIVLLEPWLEVGAGDTRSDAELVAFAAHVCQLVAELVGRAVRAEGAWALRRGVR